MDSLSPQWQQVHLILKCLFPTEMFGHPLSGRGSSRSFLPACTHCLGPSLPLKPVGFVDPALWTLNTLQTPPAKANVDPRASCPLKLGTGVPSASYIYFLLQFLQSPNPCPSHSPSDITLIPSWKTILISLRQWQRGRHGSWTRWAVL